MEIYLTGCVVALVAALVLSGVSGDLDMSPGNVVFWLVSTAFSWVGVTVYVPMLLIILFVSEDVLYRLYDFLQGLYDRLKDICDRQE